MKLNMLQTFGSAQDLEGAFCVLVEFVKADGHELLAAGIANAGQELEQSLGAAQVDGVERVVHVEGLHECIARYKQ